MTSDQVHPTQSPWQHNQVSCVFAFKKVLPRPIGDSHLEGSLTSNSIGAASTFDMLLAASRTHSSRMFML
ncbi:unnamed protein product [Protopolystoma xenopodis]|uniref:Uncharacterized protein n=1 Tax=Protopolystoma xenopodis TaxID=117903 RepID=A0A448XM61_9PLAT|nr:unnamed protein product [Protopolystoma xenopodis]